MITGLSVVALLFEMIVWHWQTKELARDFGTIRAFHGVRSFCFSSRMIISPTGSYDLKPEV